MMDEERIRNVLRQRADCITPRTGMWRQIEAELSSRQRDRLVTLPELRLRSITMVAAIVALLLSLMALYSPDAIVAQVQAWLYFIPGIGIRNVNEATLVAREPVTVQEGDITFTVQALVSDGKATTVKFSLAGLPRGKEDGGKERPSGLAARPPAFLRDAEGHEYKLTGSSYGIEGKSNENMLAGSLTFLPLPHNLRSVDLVMLLSPLVPPSLAPKSGQLEARILLGHPEDNISVPAQPMSNSVSENGLTIRALGMARTEKDLVVNVEVDSASKDDKVIGLQSPLGAGGLQVTLLDAQGQKYNPEVPSGGTWIDPYSEDLHFPSAARAKEPLILRVDKVLLQQRGSGSFSIPLKGLIVGDTIPITIEVNVGDHRVYVKSVDVINNGTEAYLRFRLDLGREQGGRTLVQFDSVESEQNGVSSEDSIGSYHHNDVGFYMIDVPVDLSKNEIRITLKHPIVIMQGSWQLKLSE